MQEAVIFRHNEFLLQTVINKLGKRLCGFESSKFHRNIWMGKQEVRHPMSLKLADVLHWITVLDAFRTIIVQILKEEECIDMILYNRSILIIIGIEDASKIHAIESRIPRKFFWRTMTLQLFLIALDIGLVERSIRLFFHRSHRHAVTLFWNTRFQLCVEDGVQDPGCVFFRC